MDWERVYIPRWGCAIHKIHDTENLYEIEEGDFRYLLCIYKLDSDSKKVEYKFDSLDEAKKFSEIDFHQIQILQPLLNSIHQVFFASYLPF